MTCRHCHEHSAFKFARTPHGRRWLCKACFEFKARSGGMLPDLGAGLVTVCSSTTRPPNLSDLESGGKYDAYRACRG